MAAPVTEPYAARESPGPAVAPRAVLPVVALATLLVVTNYSGPLGVPALLTVALDASPMGLTWALGAISLGLAATLLGIGALADRYGRRRVFALGLAGLAASCLVGATGADPVPYAAGRLLQGAASAAVLTAGLGLIGAAYPSGRARTHATGIWGAMIGLGIALGPYAASLSAAWAGWRALYVIVAIAALALLPAIRRLPESRAATPRRLDPLGMTLFTAGAAALTAGLIEGRGGWTGWQVYGPLAAGAVLLAAFAVAQWRVAVPLMDLRLLRNVAFRASAVGALFTGIAVIGLMSYLPIPLQGGLGVSATLTAVVYTLWSGTSFVFALLARHLPPRIPPRLRVAAGLLLSAAGFLMMLVLAPGLSPWLLAPGLVVSGIGSGLLNAALAGLAVGSVPPADASMGSGVNNTARYLGASIGIALFVAVGSASATGADARTVLHGAEVSFVLAAILATLGAALVLLGRDR